MSKRIETGIEVNGNVDLIAVVETLRKNQLTEEEKRLFRELYMFELNNSIEALQHIHDVAIYHSDIECWDDQKKFLQELFLLKQLIDAIRKLPERGDAMNWFMRYEKTN